MKPTTSIIHCLSNTHRILLVAFLLLGRLASAADRCDCDAEVTGKIDAYNALLTLSPSKQAAAQSRHLLWGLPAAPSDATREHLLTQQDYVIWYDDDLRIPLWVFYRLTKSDLKARRERLECFRKDPRLDAGDAGTCQDYDEPTFDRGHLVPNADMERTEAAMINTYMFSNMTPQYSNFNRGIWEKLEGMVRDWARTRKKVYVVSGAVFDKNNNGQRDADSDASRVPPAQRVAIPTHFYKIVVRTPVFGQPEAIAILLPHNNAKHPKGEYLTYLAQQIVTIKQVESLTGTSFFPNLTPAKRTALENAKATALWPTK